MLRKRVLWWGRSDLEYSRNRIVRKLFNDLGWEIIYFSPLNSVLADIEAVFRGFIKIDLVWVPCFRQRDVAAAKRWCHSKKIPFIFDPLISAYDKQIWERQKFTEESKKAKRLLKWEQNLFQSPDYVIADTQQHADFYNSKLGVSKDKLCVLPVGAEESLFYPQDKAIGSPIRVLFFGSYIALQGPEVIAAAINLYDGIAVHWTLIGNGPLRSKVESVLAGRGDVRFIDWVPYDSLSSYIAESDLCLGVFGATEKTGRVIPNKVYQALACGKPVVTSYSDAYPAGALDETSSNIYFVKANDVNALSQKLKKVTYELSNKKRLSESLALEFYQEHFSEKIIKNKLDELLIKIDF